jgi:hypothetical protein
MASKFRIDHFMHKPLLDQQKKPPARLHAQASKSHCLDAPDVPLELAQNHPIGVITPQGRGPPGVGPI